jgi:hypothetical protein
MATWLKRNWTIPSRAYHGYPMPRTDPLSDLALQRWEGALTERFKIDFQWLVREHGTPLERATLAELFGLT